MDSINAADILKDKPEFEVVKGNRGRHISVRTKSGYLLSILYSIKEGHIRIVGLNGKTIEMKLGDPEIEEKLTMLLTHGARRLL